MTAVAIFKSRLWDLAIKITVPISILAAGALINHEVRVGRIEESRFTSRDGAILEQRLTTGLVEGPTWLRTKLGEITQQLTLIDGRIRTLETRK